MKKVILLLASVMMVQRPVHAAAPTYSERVESAIADLNSVAQAHQMVLVTPAQDEKTMMREIAAQLESDEGFDENWVGDDSSAWELDSGNWGRETLSGAQNYVLGALEQALEDGDLSDAAKIEFVNNKLKVERAFHILGSIKSIKYGVSALGGAVQCGVSFPSLMILDTQTGKAYKIVMEGSGC